MGENKLKTRSNKREAFCLESFFIVYMKPCSPHIGVAQLSRILQLSGSPLKAKGAEGYRGLVLRLL